MAIVQDKKEFIDAVSTIVGVDMGMRSLVFPQQRPRVTKLIEYDFATVEGASASYNSFASTADVVEGDGKSTIVHAPLNFNESISKDAIYADAAKFGENVYGDGQIDAVTESALNGVARLQLRSLIGEKRAEYEALTTHVITDGYLGRNGTEDIVFNVPAANKQVLTNAGDELFWDNASSLPLDNLYTAFENMIVKPTIVIMDTALYGLFYSNVQIATVDNTTTGKKRNYELNTNRNNDADFFMAGTIYYKDMMLEVHVERGTYKNTVGSDVKFMDDRYAVLTTKQAGTTEYAGIPVAIKGQGVVHIATQVDVTEILTENPPLHELVYRTAPLPLMKNGNAFYSLMVKA